MRMGMVWFVRCGYTNDYAKQRLVLYLAAFLSGLSFRLNFFRDLEVLSSGEVSAVNRKCIIQETYFGGRKRAFSAYPWAVFIKEEWHWQ